MQAKKILFGMAMVGVLVLCAGCGEKEKEEDKALTPTVQTVPAGQAQTEPMETLLPNPSEMPENTAAEMQTAEPVYGEVPLLFIETAGQAEVSDNETYTDCTVSVTNCEEAYVLNGEPAGIRLRGNSTQMYEKKPYRIKFKEKQRLLGLSEGEHKSWVLLAEMNDPSLLRNFFTYRFANTLEGISYTTDCELVEVYLNQEYIGMYLLAEQTQVDDNRIALDESGVKDGSIVDTGYLLELEADSTRRKEEGNEGEAWFGVTGYAAEDKNSMQMLMERSFDETAAYYVIKSDARSAEQVTYIQKFMIQVYDAVYKEKTRTAIEELIDVSSAVDMYLVQLLGNDFDNNYSSMYVYKDAGGKLMFGAPWDFDLAYGNFNGYTEAEGTVYMYHLLRKLGEYDWFRELAAERYKEISTGENSQLIRAKELVRTVTEEAAGAFEREYARWRENLIGMGSFDGWEMPEDSWDFDGWEMPEDSWDFDGWEMPEDGWNFDGWETPEGGWDFDGWETPEGGWDFDGWEMPEGGWNFDGWEMPEDGWDFDDWSWGDFGGGANFSYGSVYDTQEEAAEAFLAWIDARLAWIDQYFGIHRESQ